MALFIQTPARAGLLEVINEACQHATSGGGVFAFASATGVRALFDSAQFAQFIESGATFQLYIGTDAITDVRAVEALSALNQQFPTISIKAVVHQKPGRIFHPKFCWFRRPDGVVLIVGSGNMTLCGLGVTEAGKTTANWEAFENRSVQDDEEIERLFSEIGQFVDGLENEGFLYDLSHPLVLRHAMENARVRIVRTKTDELELDEVEQEEVIEPEIEEAPVVDDEEFYAFIRELPDNRKGQADIGHDGLVFFGYEEGEQKSAFLQRVIEDGKTDAPKRVNVFRNKSHNYRLEVDGLREPENQTKGPDDERVLLVAVRYNSIAYRYALVNVESPHYPALSDALGKVAAARPKMRARFLSLDELTSEWPLMYEALRPVNAQLMSG